SVATETEVEIAPKPQSPSPTVETLLAAGFLDAGGWRLVNDRLQVDVAVPTDKGVYAFAKDGLVLYVGVASISLKRRMYNYCRPGSTQRTSQRVNDLIRSEVEYSSGVRIYLATPPDFDW